MRRWGLFLLVLLWAACGTAMAGLRAIAPGQLPTLAADEGLLLLAVDTSIALQSVQIAPVDRPRGSEGQLGDSSAHNPQIHEAMLAVPAGRSYHLFAASSGDYRFELARTANSLLRLGEDPELRFTVAPGGLAYVGDLVFRPVGDDEVVIQASATLANRSLAAIDWLDQHHARLHARYGMHYAGRYPDPFPAFYAQERSRALAVTPDTGDAKLPSPQSPPPLAMSNLMRAPRYGLVRLDPRGDRVAMQVREDEHDWRLDLLELKGGRVTTLLQSTQAFTAIEWAGDRRLVVSAGGEPYRHRVSVVHLDDAASGGPAFRIVQLPRAGKVLDVLRDEPDRIVFASLAAGNEMRVHRIDVSSQHAVDSFAFDEQDRLNRGIRGDLHWETDGRGELRLARVHQDGYDYWMHARDGGFTPVVRLDDDLGLEPVAVSADGQSLFALSEKGRGQRDAVVFDLARGKVSRTLFSRPGIDVETLLLDARREPLGVTYLRHGEPVSEYFRPADAAAGRQLAQRFPGRAVHLAARNDDGQRWMVWVEAPDQPATLHFVDLARGHAQRIDGNTPWLDGSRFARTQRVPFVADDGQPLDAFLTLPLHADTTARAPLVVLPHGGPIGIADSLRFDAKVQFLASLGYAVLQVNFRGSAGYGRAFREAGHANHGTRIEDDVDAAIAHVTRHFPLDPSRMCMVGASYGGYSGLVSAVRWPDRFRCIVSIGGVSDRLLSFTASDTGTTPQGRAELEKVVGDPRREFERLQASSPLYRYRDLRTPVMLAHGLEDRRVDFEHSHRLSRMLTLVGRPPVTLTFENEGHGLVAAANIDRLWTGVAGFLEQSLSAPAQAAGGARRGAAAR